MVDVYFLLVGIIITSVSPVLDHKDFLLVGSKDLSNVVPVLDRCPGSSVYGCPAEIATWFNPMPLRAWNLRLTRLPHDHSPQSFALVADLVALRPGANRLHPRARFLCRHAAHCPGAGVDLPRRVSRAGARSTAASLPRRS